MLRNILCHEMPLCRLFVFPLTPKQYSHRTYVLEENKRPENLKINRTCRNRSWERLDSPSMNKNSSMLLMGSCLYLYTFRLSNAFIQINTNTNGIGLQTVFIFYLYLTWPAMNTGEGDLFYYLKYFFSFF